MSEESINKKDYGVADIERYYSGKMQPNEMHLLEKAALEDPFLADAMEGYIHTNNPSADVDALKNQLLSRQHKEKVFSLNERKSYNKFFKVAAMIISMLGAGWLVYEFAFNKPNTDISYSNQLEINNSISNADTAPVDLNSTKQKPAVDNATEENENTNRAANNINKKKNLIREQNKINKQNKQLPEIQEKEMASSDSIKVKVDDQVASIASNRMATAIKQEAPQDSDASNKRTIVVVGAENMNAKIKTYSNDKRVTITIMKAQDGINELVLKQPMKDSVHKKSTSIIIEEAEPEESWSKFGEYISDNLKTPEDLEKESIKGTVKISFDVNASGEPVNLHVEKSLCEKCDAEALRLLKEGPKWKRKTKRGKVSFNF